MILKTFFFFFFFTMIRIKIFIVNIIIYTLIPLLYFFIMIKQNQDILHLIIDLYI